MCGTVASQRRRRNHVLVTLCIRVFFRDYTVPVLVLPAHVSPLSVDSCCYKAGWVEIRPCLAISLFTNLCFFRPWRRWLLCDHGDPGGVVAFLSSGFQNSVLGAVVV